MPRRDILSPEQRIDLFALPRDEGALIRLYTLSQHDLAQVRRNRGEHNRLGFAVLLCHLRYPGQELWANMEPDPRLIALMAKQIGVNPSAWARYAKREPTRREHMLRLMEVYGYQSFTTAHYQNLLEWLHPMAMQTEQGILLAQALFGEVRARRIIVPPIATIERLCAEASTRAERAIDKSLTQTLTPQQKLRLDNLLLAHEGARNFSTLTWIRQPPGASNAKNIIGLISKLKMVRGIGLPESLSQAIHQNRLLKLARVAVQTTAQHLRRFDEEQRHALIVALLLETSATLTDEVLAMHERILGTVFARAKRQHQEAFSGSAQVIKEKLKLLDRIGKALVEAKRTGGDPYAAIEAVVPWETFEASVADADKLDKVTAEDSLGLIGSWYSQIRRYAPVLLESFQFNAAPVSEDLLEGINLLRRLNESHTRLVPPDAPTKFVRRRWERHVVDGDTIDRRYYELCVLSEMKNALRSGDLWVKGSRQFKDFEDYLLSPEAFARVKAGTLPLSIEADGVQYLSRRLGLLREELEKVNDLAARGELPDVSIANGVLKVTPLTNAVPEEAGEAMRRAYRLLPHPRITELLLEVDQWTGFTRHFTNQKTGAPARNRELLLAAVLADGLNLGLTKMAEACPDATYTKLSWLAAWHIRDETYAEALAEIVNAIHRHPLATAWGEGTTSSSDGQRFQVGGRGEPVGAVNLKYGTNPSSLIYTFISDRYAPFHSRVINATARDATYVLDGLLYHESDIRIEEHYTDTAGFTDHVFGLCHLLGFRFAPRIRDLNDKRLYLPGKEGSYPALDGLIGGTINQAHLLTHWDEILRLATSIRQGTVTASLMLRKLGSYPRQNGLALALREVGRIDRTLFLLKWLQDPELRRRVHAGLNKGEARNALARAVFFYRLGEMRDRSFENQNYRASGLNLVVAAIILWNAMYLERSIKFLEERGEAIREDLIPHLSPLGWEHINLTGDYVWKLSRKVAKGQFRPLWRPEGFAR